MIKPFPRFDDTPSPASHWYYELTHGVWKPFLELSYVIEDAYKINRNGILRSLPYQMEINFSSLRYYRKGDKDSKRIQRAIWYWHDDDLSWSPYSPEIGEELERQYKNNETIKVKVTSNPPRHIEKNYLGHFTQYRKTSGGKPEGREVTRGYPGEGKTYERDNGPSSEYLKQEFESVKKSWTEFITKGPQNQNHDLTINFEIFCDGLNILGYTYQNSNWDRSAPSPLANILYNNFIHNYNNILIDVTLFESLILLVRGEPKFCQKWAYDCIMGTMKDSQNPLISGIESTLNLFLDILRSLGIGGRQKRVSEIAKLLHLSKEDKQMDLEKYRVLLDMLSDTYFGKVPPLRRKVSDTLSHIFPLEGIFPFAINISLGIQLSVEKSAFCFEQREDVPISHSDCGEEFLFRLASYPNLVKTEPPLNITFRAFAPQVFRAIRYHYGITDSDFLLSIGIESLLFQLLFAGQLNTYRTVGSHGRSGSVFFYTYDNKFMIKTLKPQEVNCLIRNLPEYFTYLTSPEKSYIVPFLGLYHVTEVNGRCEYVCVMKNLFHTPNLIDEIFDLKGSRLDRVTPPENRKPGVPLKDVDFGDRVIPLTSKISIEVIKQIEKDVNFFTKSMKTMDYSFLVGYHIVNHNTVINQENPEWENIDGGIFSYSKDRIYYFGIIDYLVEYDVNKFLETMAKRARAKKEEISSVDPNEYSERFKNYLVSKIWSPDQSTTNRIDTRL